MTTPRVVANRSSTRARAARTKKGDGATATRARADARDERSMTSESESSSNVSEAVTASARSIAALRALEHARGCGTRIFEDSYARALAGEAAYARVVAKAKARRASSRGAEGDDEEEEDDARVWCVDDGRVAIRTRFFDDACERWTRETEATTSARTRRQIVLLGAGFDSRCWRLGGNANAVGTLTAYEADDARVLDEKEKAMKDATLTLVASRRVVRCDLERGDWFAALVRAGYDATLPTLFVLEGLMYYLSPRRARRLTRECAARSGPSSAMVVSVVNPAALRRATREPLGAKIARFFGRGKPKTARQSWKSSCDAPPETYFDAWDVDTVGQLGDDVLHYGRWTGKTPTEYPRDARAYRREKTPRTFYVFARKRDDTTSSRRAPAASHS